MKYSFQRSGLLLGFFALALIASCSKFNKSPIKDTYLDSEIPDYTKTGDLSQNTKIHIGRILFYDKNLSINNSVACASCHKQQFAFADNVALSNGFENIKTKRNSIAIQNIGKNGIFTPAPFGEGVLFWDGRESSLISLISKPIANHIEMGMENTDLLLKKINSLPYYKPLLLQGHSENEMTMSILADDMALFLSNITAINSAFDQRLLGVQTQWSPLAEKGLFLFNNTYQCNNCHNPSVGTYGSSGFRNIGLDGDNPDKGRMNITNASADEGTFKVPDLHNVGLTAPYMHDGRFNTLDEVLEHYSHGIKENKNLSPILQRENGHPLQMNITADDKIALIAFLNSMTDYTNLTNPELSNPFKSK